MWDFRIAGEDLYHILNWFFIYSFLGWVWESCYVSVKERRLVNRGFVTGPVCTIYGFGAVSVYLILKPIAGNLLLLYLGGVIVPTILEYLTALLMEQIFHMSWWDYSKNKFNFQGRICLGASLGWGIFSVILFYGFQPVVDRIAALYSVAAGKALVTTAAFAYAVDFGMSFLNAMQVGERLGRMDELMEEMSELRKRLETRVDALVAFTAGMTTAEHKAKQEEFRLRLEERLASLHSRYEQMKAGSSRLNRRIMNAYPNLKSRRQALKERVRNRENK